MSGGHSEAPDVDLDDEAGDDVDYADREEMRTLLEDGIREAHRQVTEGRVRDPERDEVRIQWVRALAYAVGQYRQLSKDLDLEEMAEEIETLQAAQDEQNAARSFRVR